jgi:hypothetical protein
MLAQLVIASMKADEFISSTEEERPFCDFYLAIFWKAESIRHL